jgi:hypothetical protein
MWTAIASVVGALISWYGTSLQEDETKKSQSYAEGQNAKTFAEGQREFDTNVKLKKQELYQNEQGIQQNQTKMNIGASSAVAGNLLSMLNTKPQLQSVIAKMFQPKQSPYDFKGMNPLGRTA